MPRAYSISVDAIAAERRRVNDDLEQFDVSRVIELDELALRPMGPRDVHLRILAVSAEHNVDHAALADTVNIAQLRGGKIYPGNSAVGEVTWSTTTGARPDEALAGETEPHAESVGGHGLWDTDPASADLRRCGVHPRRSAA